MPKDTEFSELDLQATFDAIERLEKSHPRFQIQGYGTYPRENIVRVTLVASAGADAQIRQSVSTELGGNTEAQGASGEQLRGALVVETVEAPIDPADGEESQIRGGDSLLGNPGGVCSIGAWGFVPFGWLTVPLMVTADHCSDIARHGRGGAHDPNLTRAAGQNFGNADAQSMSTPDWTEATNRVHRPGPGHWTIAAVVQRGALGDRVGDWVCKQGQTTGETCGTIEATNVACRGHHTMRAATYASGGGDSGAPVFVPLPWGDIVLAGIHEGRETCSNGTSNAMYSHQENARRAAGITGWRTN